MLKNILLSRILELYLVQIISLDSIKKYNPIAILIKLFSGGKNRRFNDYILRFKVTSNAGRAFIFHQMGIPAIGDFGLVILKFLDRKIVVF